MATIIMCKNKIAHNVAYRAYRDGAVGVAMAAQFLLTTIPQCRCVLYRYYLTHCKRIPKLASTAVSKLVSQCIVPATSKSKL